MNHELAGQALNFEVELLDLTPAERMQRATFGAGGLGNGSPDFFLAVVVERVRQVRLLFSCAEILELLNGD